MSTPDENKAKTDTKPLLDAVQEDGGQDGGADGHTPADEPRSTVQAAMEEALKQSGRRPEDLTAEETENGGTTA